MQRWVAGLAVAGLLAGCGGAADQAGDGAPRAEAIAGAVAEPDVDTDTTVPTTFPTGDFEGTMRQLTLSLDADAVRKIVGSNDPAAVMDFPPEKLIDAVLAGQIEAESIDHAVLEIDGRMGRFQTEGDDAFSIIDGNAAVVRVVNPDDRMIVTMSPRKMAAMQAGKPMGDLEVEQLGQREIRGFNATGYRFDFIGNVATVWLSPDLEAATGPLFGIWAELNPLGRLPLGRGATVRSIMVNPEALGGGSSFMPAYTLTEFHELQRGSVSDERFASPEGYRHVDMADMAAMGRAAL